MKIARVRAIYFSPVGNTKKVILSLASVVGEKMHLPVEQLDYTLPAAREKINKFSSTDLIIWGTPVYAGRIPNKLLSYVQNNFIGNGALAVPVVVFGNRHFDDALMELRNCLEANEFHTIAGAGLVAQHAFSQVLATKRPDQRDKEQMEEFATRIVEKLNKLKAIPEPVQVVGTNPPKKYYTPKGLDGNTTNFLKAKPKTDRERCTQCSICTRHCPMGVIQREDPSQIIGTCIKCHSCVKRCPFQAKYFDDEQFISHKRLLERDFSHRAAASFFI